MKIRSIMAAALAAAGLAGTGLAAQAQTVELKIQHFLPAVAPAQKVLIEPWAKALEEPSKGRIKSRIFPSMQLGGQPPQLYYPEIGRVPGRECTWQSV